MDASLKSIMHFGTGNRGMDLGDLPPYLYPNQKPTHPPNLWINLKFPYELDGNSGRIKKCQVISQ